MINAYPFIMKSRFLYFYLCIRKFSKTFPKNKNEIITVFDLNVGNDQPESKGGTHDVNNLKPICARCNLSMSDNYTIEEWNKLTKQKKKPKRNLFNCW